MDVFQPKQPMTGRQAVTIAPLAAAIYANPSLAIPAGASTAWIYGTKSGRNFAAGKLGVQQAARGVEREVRRAIPKEGRETVARYGRNALLTYADD